MLASKAPVVDLLSSICGALVVSSQQLTFDFAVATEADCWSFRITARGSLQFRKRPLHYVRAGAVAIARAKSPTLTAYVYGKRETAACGQLRVACFLVTHCARPVQSSSQGGPAEQEVREEDQQSINTFNKLNIRSHELQAGIKAKKVRMGDTYVQLSR